MSDRVPEHIGFTGTQRGWTYSQADAAARRLGNLRRAGALWMHNGDCVGADAAAARWWKSFGGKIHLHPPTERKKRAFLRADTAAPAKPYLERNADIAQECGALVATPREMQEELRSGTWSTIRRARKLGRAIYIVWPDGSETFEPANP